MKTSLGILAALAAIFGTATSASAQSLEESYANLCSDEAMKQSEACVALRRAMLEKLNAENGIIAQPVTRADSEQADTERGQIPEGSSAFASPARTPDFATMQSLTLADAASDGRWGVFARLVGTNWASEDMGPKHNPEKPRVMRLFASFSFLDGGQALEIQEGVELTKPTPSRTIILTPTSQPRVFHGLITQSLTQMSWRVPFRLEDNATLVSDWYKVTDAGHGVQEMHARFGYKLMSDGTLAALAARGFGKNRPPMSELNAPEASNGRLRVYNPSVIQVFISEQLASFSDVRQMEIETEALQAQLVQMERERAQRKASSGGILGVILGLGVGLLAGDAYGLDTSQTIGAAMKGVQLMNPNSELASTFGGMGEQLLTGGNTGMAAATGGAVSSAASYPTKPNLAGSACSGFTEGNYRQQALQGGGDSQLHTMCGQAFEYYTMYKRAIAQGASQADAERTYEAHRQAAQTASGYLSSHAAN